MRFMADSSNIKVPNIKVPNIEGPKTEVPAGDSDFPIAVVKERSRKLLASARLWWLALACLLVSIGLVLRAMPSRGTHVQIQFPQGHGLKAEDAVRYRGIDVGVVTSVYLTDSLDAVDVHVELFPTAAPLAVEGTKFWIVRPQLSISGVSGLETAVGHKYIRVQPGPVAQKVKRYFDGLASAPVDNGAHSGIEILLQADQRHSVNVGSAIHFRGVDIGRILSVELSPDARRVEIRGKIEEAYRSLVTTESKFWATGGVDFDFSLTQGLKLETESLDTLARGGVSMLVTGDGTTVEPGHVFALAAQAEENWWSQARNYRATSAHLRGALNLTATWTETGLLGIGKRKRSVRCAGIGLKIDGRAIAAYPADVLDAAETALDDSFELRIAEAEKGVAIPKLPSGEIVFRLVDAKEIPSQLTFIDGDEVLQSAESAGWIAVRKSNEGGVFHHLPIEAKNIKSVQTEQDASPHWSISDFVGDRALWHGTPVLQSSDSKLVGMLLIGDSDVRIVPVPSTIDP